MVVARDEDRDPLALTPVADLPLHPESLGDLGLEAAPEAFAILRQRPSRKNSVRR